MVPCLFIVLLAGFAFVIFTYSFILWQYVSSERILVHQQQVFQGKLPNNPKSPIFATHDMFKQAMQ